MTKPVDELLYDSEAALRQVDSALFSMTGEAPPPPVGPSRQPEGRTHPNGDPGSLTAQGHEELLRVLQDLSSSRARVPNGDDTNQQLQHATAMLAQVESRLASVLNALAPVASADAVTPSPGNPRAGHDERDVLSEGVVAQAARHR